MTSTLRALIFAGAALPLVGCNLPGPEFYNGGVEPVASGNGTAPPPGGFVEDLGTVAPVGAVTTAPVQPARPTAPTAPTGPTRPTHQVAPGESLSRIAERHGTSTAALADLNNLAPPYSINSGTTLLLPGTPGTSIPGDSPPTPGARVVAPSGAAVTEPDAPAQVTPREPPAATAGTPDVVAAAPGGALTETPPTEQGPIVIVPQEETIPPEFASIPAGRFEWPVRGRVLLDFGPIDNGLQNDGINIAAPTGTAIRAAQAGRVAYASDELSGFGNLVLIRHDGNWVTAYAHADRLMVEKEDLVTAGQVIGVVGSTGSVDEPQLHFEIRRGTEPLNPREYLPSR